MEEIANVVVNEIEFDDVNEKIADLEIAKMEMIENGWGFAKKKVNYYAPIFSDFWFWFNVFVIKIIKQY